MHASHNVLLYRNMHEGRVFLFFYSFYLYTTLCEPLYMHFKLMYGFELFLVRLHMNLASVHCLVAIASVHCMLLVLCIVVFSFFPPLFLVGILG
jgi:hypothetical protein